MIFLPPLLFATVLGLFFLLFLAPRIKVRWPFLFYLALAPCTGFSLCSLLLFWSYVLTGTQAKFFTMFSSCTALAFFLAVFIRRYQTGSDFDFGFKKQLESWRSIPLKEKILIGVSAALWIYAFSQFLHIFEIGFSRSVFGGWDAKFFWNVKAKFFFRDPSQWMNMFSPDLSWTHPDYPLLLPGTVAWGWNWTGKEILIWPVVVGFVFLFSLVLFVLWYLGSQVHPASGLLGSAFLMSIGTYLFWGFSQYADIPLCFFMTVSGAFLVLAARSSENQYLLLSGWFAGSAAWTKNEGLPFVIWIAVLGIYLLWKHPLLRKARKNTVLALIRGLALPIGSVWFIKTFLGKSGDYLNSGRSAGELLKAIFGDWEKTKIIMQSFPVFMFNNSSWNGLWLFFFSALFFLAVEKRLRENYTWLFAATALMIEAGYFVVLHTSPHDILWQIDTALRRLILHAGALGLLFCFETYGRMTLDGISRKA